MFCLKNKSYVILLMTLTFLGTIALDKCAINVLGSEPICSRFHYEEQTLEKMIRQEIAVEKMKSEMEDMKRKVESTLADIDNEKNKIAMELEKKNMAFALIEQNMENVVNAIKARNDENIIAYSKELEKVKASAFTSLVAFKAHKVTDTIVSNNKIVIFTENLLNMGDGYNNKTGVFVAPVAGLYFFTAQLCVDNDDLVAFGIYKNDLLISRILVGNKYWSSCMTIADVTMLDQGDKISVKCALGFSSGDKLMENIYLTNSFTGVLLNQLTV